MKVELKNIKVCRFASQETECFEASIYIDGKKVGSVDNDGRGGTNRYYFNSREVREAFEKHCKSLPDVDVYGSMLPMSDDLFISQLMDEYEKMKQIRRWCKTKTVFRLPSDAEGEFRTLNYKWNPMVKAKILAKYPDAEFMNEKVA
jgi:hypothetical protein